MGVEAALGLAGLATDRFTFLKRWPGRGCRSDRGSELRSLSATVVRPLLPLYRKVHRRETTPAEEDGAMASRARPVFDQKSSSKSGHIVGGLCAAGESQSRSACNVILS